MITYVKGDLFSAKCALLHACNCRQQWGNGVARTFANKFPRAYDAHKKHKASLGGIQVIDCDTQPIVCLFTSHGYGHSVDPVDKILQNTELSLSALGLHYLGKQVQIASPKINAGLFRVPWGKTEKLIESFLDANPNVSWTIYELLV